MEQAPIAEQPNQLSKSVDVAIKLVGDFGVVPGASQFMNGRLGSGLGHAAAGVVAGGVGVAVGGAAGAVLGPLGWALVAANSFTKSVTSKNIWTHLSGTKESIVEGRADRHQQAVLDEVKAAREKDEADRSEYEKALVGA